VATSRTQRRNSGKCTPPSRGEPGAVPVMAAHAFPVAGVEPDALATVRHAVVDPGLEQVQGSRPARHVVVTAPAEVDFVNAADLGSRLKAACGSTDVITVDMTATRFCDAAGVRALLEAWKLAKASGGELRLAISCPAVLRVLQLTGLAQALPVYADVGQSLGPPRAEGSSPPPRRDADPADQHAGLTARVPQPEAADLPELGACLPAPGEEAPGRRRRRWP
jgi:anti-sigma B factor antagonist